MGGAIGVTIREEDGKEHRMCRWTNQLPYFVNSPLLCEKNTKYVADYLKTWYEMVEDWEQSGHDEAKCRLNMTSCYAPEPFLAPISYGLVVIDMQRDAILSMNGYSSMGRAHAVSLLYELRCEDGEAEADPGSRLASLRGFADRGRVIGAKFNEKGRGELVSLRSKGFGAIVSFISDDANRYADIQYDMSPFAVEEFPESREGAAKMRERILALGFELSKQEEELWEEWKAE